MDQRIHEKRRSDLARQHDYAGDACIDAVLGRAGDSADGVSGNRQAHPVDDHFARAAGVILSAVPVSVYAALGIHGIFVGRADGGYFHVGAGCDLIFRNEEKI